MDESKNDPASGVINWNNFKQMFGKDFPFPVPDKFDDLTWIDKYVQDAMKQYLPKPLRINTKTHNYRMEMFETHKNVIVKLYLTEAEVRNASVSVGVNSIQLDGIPDYPNKTIKLPAYVDPDSCAAVFKNGVLQLHMRKQVFDDYFREVKVKFPK
jgi:HSP20 family molecular chaperone IbpA